MTYMKQNDADETRRKALYEKVKAKLTPEGVQMFDEAVKALKPIVEIIESMPETTKEHYEEYMRFAINVPACLVLLCAGANIIGVAGAAMVNGVAGMDDLLTRAIDKVVAGRN